MGDLLPSSDCIMLSVLRCKREKDKLFRAITQSYFTILFPTFSHIGLHSWWEASPCPSEGEAGSFTLSSSSARLSLMITVSQQVLHFFFLFSPSFAYLHLYPSLPLDCCLLWTNPLPLKDEIHHVVVWLWSGATIPITLLICASPQQSRIRILVGSCGEREQLPLLLGLFILPSLWSAVEILFSSYFGLFQQTEPAAIVFFWPLHTWQSLIRAFAFNSCGGRLIPLLICVHFPDDQSVWLPGSCTL